eukprot:gene5-505_t
MGSGSDNKREWRERKRDEGRSWTDINGPGRQGAGAAERYDGSDGDGGAALGLVLIMLHAVAIMAH